MRKRRTKAITAAAKESQKIEEKPEENIDLSDFMNKPTVNYRQTTTSAAASARP